MHPLKRRFGTHPQFVFIALGALACLVIVVLAAFLYRLEQRDSWNRSRMLVAAVNDLKARWVEDWVAERVRDAVRDAKAPLAIASAREALGLPHGHPESEVGQMQATRMLRGGAYVQAMIVDRTAKVRFAAGEGEFRLEGPALRLMRRLVEGGMDSGITDFQVDRDGNPYVDVVGVIRADDGVFLGWVILRSSPEAYFYDRLWKWPVMTQSAETYLVKMEGGMIRYLSPRRHVTTPPLSGRRTVRPGERHLERSISGGISTWVSRDYRDVEVLVSTVEIPTTGWRLVSKIDLEEVVAPARARTVALVLAVGAAVALIAFTGGFVHWRREERSRRLLDTLREREESMALEFRARLESSYKEIESLFSSMLEGFALHELVRDASGKAVDYRFLHVNPAFERLTGLSAKQVEGRLVTEVLPGTEPGWLKTYADVVTTGRPIVFEMDSGALGKVFRVAAFRPQEGRFAALFEDVTEIRKAERIARAHVSELEALRTALDGVGSHVYMKDLSSRYTYANRPTLELFGVTAKELVGKGDQDFFPPEVVTRLRAIDLKVFLGENTHEEIVVESPGQPRQIYVETKTPLHDPEDPNRIVGLLGISTNITELRKMEEALLRTQRLESIGTLAAGVAHDLNNILAPIRLSAELLRYTPDVAARDSLVDNIETLVVRGSEVIRQVLTFARGTAGERLPVNLGQLVGEMRKIIGETFPRSITLHVDQGRDIPCVLGDATQLHQVLLNLCINARDAMPEGGTLRLALNRREAVPAQDPRYVVVTVEDSGCGITPEVLGKIFDPFFTTKEQGKGTGLGLSTALGIVRSHGGTIEVDSIPGKGSTFRVVLPEYSSQDRAAKHQVEESKQHSGSTATILVVDDEELILQTAGMVLRRGDFRVLTARSGGEALDLCRDPSIHIDVVVTDLMMPGIDGFALIAELRSYHPRLAIVASTGQLTPEVEAKLAAMAIRSVLTKPYGANRLTEAVGKAMASR